MDFAINVMGRELKPRIINIKQYSAGVDKIVFNGLDAIASTGKLYIKGDKYKAPVDSYADGKAEWSITKGFTSKAGTKELQLYCEDGDKIWLSDIMILIVSESSDGNESEIDNKKGISMVGLPEIGFIVENGLMCKGKAIIEKILISEGSLIIGGDYVGGVTLLEN